MFSVLIIFGFLGILFRLLEEYIESPNWKAARTAFFILFFFQTAIILLCYVNKEN